jgi:hypothetical protein
MPALPVTDLLTALTDASIREEDLPRFHAREAVSRLERYLFSLGRARWALAEDYYTDLLFRRSLKRYDEILKHLKSSNRSTWVYQPRGMGVGQDNLSVSIRRALSEIIKLHEWLVRSLWLLKPVGPTGPELLAAEEVRALEDKPEGAGLQEAIRIAEEHDQTHEETAQPSTGEQPEAAVVPADGEASADETPALRISTTEPGPEGRDCGIPQHPAPSA